jgi:glycosyltransferase involved in cell wall biosynthesis
MRRLNIAYISRSDPRDIKNWSGTPYFIVKSLQEHVGDVTYLGELRTYKHFIGKVVNGLLSPWNLRYNYAHSVPLAKSYSSILGRRLRDKEFDVIITHESTGIASLKTKFPIILVTDATFSALEQYYQYFSNLLKFSSAQSRWVENSAFQNASLLFFASEWAAAHARDDYLLRDSKIHVLRFGANMIESPDSVKFRSRKFDPNQCKLLFVGVNWYRKGGNIAFDTMIELNNRGIDARLTVCGTTPPKHIRHKNLTIIPFLNKSNQQDRQRLFELYSNADYFILPTRNECAGLVFCEASAFGLPIIATDTGGVPSYVYNDINGYLLSMDAGGKDYADTIMKISHNKDLYDRLSESGRRLFEEKLNWDIWALNVRKIIYDELGF